MKKTVFAALAALVLTAGAFAADFPSYLKVSGTTITGYTDGVPASLTIPAGITKIGDHALMGCTAIKSAAVPGSVTELEPGAFSGCSSLVSVTIAEGVTHIGDDLFGYCEKIKKVRFGGTKAQWQSFKVSLNSGAVVRCSDGNITVR